MRLPIRRPAARPTMSDPPEHRQMRECSDFGHRESGAQAPAVTRTPAEVGAALAATLDELGDARDVRRRTAARAVKR